MRGQEPDERRLRQTPDRDDSTVEWLHREHHWTTAARARLDRGAYPDGMITAEKQAWVARERHGFGMLGHSGGR